MFEFQYQMLQSYLFATITEEEKPEQQETTYSMSIL